MKIMLLRMGRPAAKEPYIFLSKSGGAIKFRVGMPVDVDDEVGYEVLGCKDSQLFERVKPRPSKKKVPANKSMAGKPMETKSED